MGLGEECRARGHAGGAEASVGPLVLYAALLLAFAQILQRFLRPSQFLTSTPNSSTVLTCPHPPRFFRHSLCVITAKLPYETRAACRRCDSGTHQEDRPREMASPFQEGEESRHVFVEKGSRKAPRRSRVLQKPEVITSGTLSASAAVRIPSSAIPQKLVAGPG